MAFFRPSDPFVRAEPLHLGSKFEYFLTNPGISNPPQTERYCRQNIRAAVMTDNCPLYHLKAV